MYKHILLPTDGSETSKNAIMHGIALAAVLNARVSILAVTSPLHCIMSDPTPVVDIPGAEAFVHDYLHGQAKEYLDAAAAAAAERHVACETIHAEHEHPYAAIIDTAQVRGCDLIVMASHGRRGILAIVLGSETGKVLTHSKIPVLVHRS